MDWIITSPPYYGMRTYLPDQWLRLWFLGGPSTVCYEHPGQLHHTSPDSFAAGLRSVWNNCATKAKAGARMVIRFGAINDRKVDSLALLKESLVGTSWRITTVHTAGTAHYGRRQATQFTTNPSAPITEHDLWAFLSN